MSRIRPYKKTKSPRLRSESGEAKATSEILSQVASKLKASMPSNERRVHQNGGNHDAGNFKTTLVLHLKEKESMPRNNQSSKLEKTEKLIGKSLIPFSRKTWTGEMVKDVKKKG